MQSTQSASYPSYLVPSSVDLPQGRHFPRKGDERLSRLAAADGGALVFAVAVPDEVDGGGAKEQLAGDFVLWLDEFRALHVSEGGGKVFY